MRKLVRLGGNDTELVSLKALRSFCRDVLAGVPGGAALIFDDELRVTLAEGPGFAQAGAPEHLIGRLLSDVLSAKSWAQLRVPYLGALAGRTTRFDFASRGSVFSIHVSPLTIFGEAPGGLAVSHEITEQREQETSIAAQASAAEASEELLRSAFDRAPIGMTVVDLDGRWLRVNEEYCRMLGYNGAELAGATFRDLTHPDDVAQDREFLAAAAGGELDSLQREKRYVHKDGRIVWVHLRSELIRDQAGEPLYVVSHLQDISARRAAECQLRDSERTLRSVIDNTPGVVYVKGRDFRYQLVNRQFEQLFAVRRDWMVGRRDEDILPDEVIDEVRAKDRLVLDRGRTTQDEETIQQNGQERVYLTMRFPLRDERDQIQAACAISTDITERRHQEREGRKRLQCSDLIHTALAQDRFVLHGQPIVNLNSMQVEQAELLVRMLKARGGREVIAPGEFLPAAERFDLIQVIDEWVVDRALEVAAAGHCVEVNLSARTISAPARVDRIEQAILASPAQPGNLIFEITETAVADNLDAAREFATRLRKLGCAFALDDFGVGHGTFTYLRHLSADYLKIDIQFVRDLLSDETDRQVVQAIVGVASEFGIKTIAEGVESQAILEELRRIGVDYAQGYWIGRPVPLAQLWSSQPSPGGGHT